MFDRTFPQSRRRWYRTGGCIHDRLNTEIQFQNLLRPFTQLFIRWYIEDRDASLHQMAYIAAFRAFTEGITTIRTTTITLRIGNNELFVVG